ncbi:histidinol-phosphate transaminase [Fructilactobacillus frigidiflavus]|uniref:histidinol-phosphate transaminase n=1 Tax=Fructilactobacillus frigidiflavus TaxID=3242688 RepID=UPI0037568D4B
MKANLAQLTNYQGELPIAALKKQFKLNQLVRLSANESSFGPSPQVVQALQATDFSQLNRYPDGSATALRTEIAKLEGINPQQIVFGTGADELIELICRVTLTNQGNMVQVSPTFGEYGIQAQIEGTELREIPVNENTGKVEFAKLKAAIDERTELIWLANPNNPTGVFEDPQAIQTFLRDLPSQTVLVLDEAYIEFVNEAAPSVIKLVAQFPNLVVLRTLSKAYGLANLRIGYGVASGKMLNALQSIRLPYNLSNFQIAGGKAALTDQAYVHKVVQVVQQERQQWEAFLQRHLFTFYPSAANFMFVKVQNAQRVGDYLLQNGYQVKYPVQRDWLRITIGKPADNQAVRNLLLEATNA